MGGDQEVTAKRADSRRAGPGIFGHSHVTGRGTWIEFRKPTAPAKAGQAIRPRPLAMLAFGLLASALFVAAASAAGISVGVYEE
jgi:hypothetical protein